MLPPREAHTTMLAQRAVKGELEALGALVERFDPPLLALARRRLARGLQQFYDPEDLVADTWLRSLPRLQDLEPRDGRITPVIMRFLSTTLLHRYNTLLQKHLLGKPAVVRIGPADSKDDGGMADSVTHVLSGMERNERADALYAAIGELSESDQEVVYLRAIEQVSNRNAADLLGIQPGALKTRYCRALQRLRARLPESVFADLPED